MLKPEKADHYDSWIKVGLLLNNLSPQLVDVWLDFSKQSSKYDEVACLKQWAKFKQTTDGYTMGTLHYWAKEDSPEQYQRFYGKKTNLIFNMLSCTDYDVAYYLKSKYGAEFVSCNDCWYQFTEHRWKMIEKGMSLALLISTQVWNEVNQQKICTQSRMDDPQCTADDKKMFTAVLKKYEKLLSKLKSEEFIKKVLQSSDRLFNDEKFQNNLDSDPNLLGFNNGIFDLKTKILRKGCPSDYVSLSCGYDYVTSDNYGQYSDPKHPIIEQVTNFVSTCITDQLENLYLWRLMSSMLLGANPDERFHIWTGVGRNGKSKVALLLSCAMGDYAKTIPVGIIVGKSVTGEAAQPQLAQLRGKRYVFCGEPDKQDHLNCALIKLLTGNDPITCRMLNKSPFTHQPQYKILCLCNDKPDVDADDIAFWDRCNILNFKSRFVDNPDASKVGEYKCDNKIKDKIPMWKEAFMYLLTTNYFPSYMMEGLNPPASVKHATAQYRDENDRIAIFMDQTITQTGVDSDTIQMKDLWDIFKKSDLAVKGDQRKNLLQSLTKKGYRVSKVRKVDYLVGVKFSGEKSSELD